MIDEKIILHNSDGADTKEEEKTKSRYKQTWFPFIIYMHEKICVSLASDVT